MASEPVLASEPVSLVKFTNHTGHVIYFFTGVDNYTFVSITTATSNVAGYYIGDNAAVASVIDNAKRLNQKITVSIENTSGKIIYVR